MKNYIQPGDNLTVNAPYALTAGQGALVGAIFGVAVTDAANGAPVVLATSGVFDLTALSTDVNAVGEKAYWDNTNKRVTEASSGNTFIGHFTAVKADAATVSRVVLRPAGA